MSVPLIDRVVPEEPDRDRFDALHRKEYQVSECWDCYCGKNSREDGPSEALIVHLIQVYKWALEQKERNLHGNK